MTMTEENKAKLKAITNLDNDKKYLETQEDEIKKMIQEGMRKATDIKAWLQECTYQIDEPKAKDYLTARGIEIETANKYLLGYDAINDAITIPMNKDLTAYTERYIDNPNQRYKNQPGAPTAIFNEQALYNPEEQPVFIFEGVFDAISSLQLGAEAIAINGTGNINKLVEAIKTAQEQAKAIAPIVLCLDNDNAGKTALKTLVDNLEKIGVHDAKKAIDGNKYIIANVAGSYKDANERLINDNPGLEADLTAWKNYKKQLKQEYDKENRTDLIFNKFLDDLQQNKGYKPISTGFKYLDTILDGGLYAGLYTLGAITSLGKTTLLLQIADNIAKNENKPVFIYALEMSKTELISKSISRETYLKSMHTDRSAKYAKTNRQIMRGDFTGFMPIEKQNLYDSFKSYQEYAKNVYIKEAVSMVTAENIRQEVSYFSYINGEAPIVIIDYLQLLAPANQYQNEKQSTDYNIMALKQISRDFKTPLIVTSSLNRNSYKDAINQSAFKESGAIEYSSDVLLGMQLKGAGTNGFNADEAKEKNPREIELKILKNRNGTAYKTLEFKYYKAFNYYENTGIQRDNS